MLAILARQTVAVEQPVLAAHGLSMWGYIVLSALDRSPIRTQAALAEAIAHDGTTLRDYRTVDGGSGSNQFRLSCYGRFGEPCERCGAELRRRTIDARTTTWCATCQRR